MRRGIKKKSPAPVQCSVSFLASLDPMLFSSGFVNILLKPTYWFLARGKHTITFSGDAAPHHSFDIMSPNVTDLLTGPEGSVSWRTGREREREIYEANESQISSHYTNWTFYLPFYIRCALSNPT